MKRLLIAGAGGLGREVAAWAPHCHGHGVDWELGGFLDDNPHALDGFAMGELRVVGSIRDYRPAPEEVVGIALGLPKIRKELCDHLDSAGAVFANLIHQSVIMGARVKLGRGVLICPRAVLSVDIEVGDFVGINLCCTVGHDVRIGAYSQLSAQCDLTGGVQLGEGVFMGSGARVIPQVTVGDWAVLGAGSVTVRKVPAGMTVVGVPARPLVI